MPAQEVVLITGAAGFIGSAVIRRLAGKYPIVGLDRPGLPDPPDPAVAVDFDLSNEEAVHSALETVRSKFGRRIASVVHLAAYYDITGDQNPLYEQITVEGTRRLIDALQDFEVEQFVFASTMLVHQPTALPDTRISEESPLGPSWPYPKSKLKTEELLRTRHRKIPVVFLRIAGVYDDMGHSAFLAEQIAGVYEHRTTAHLYPGMLCAAQSNVHLDDLTEAVARLLEARKELPPELALLIGEPDALGYAEIQDIVHRELHGKDWSTVRIPKTVAKIGAWLQNEVLGEDLFVQQWMIDEASSHYIVDIGRARSLLGWEPRRSLRETLPKIVGVLKADPQRWYKANKLNPAVVAWDAGDGAAEPNEGGRGSEDRPSTNGHAGMHSDAHMNHDEHMAQMAQQERNTRWAHLANIGLGLWLASSPAVYDAVSAETVRETVLAVTADRGLPSVEWRASALAVSDIASGLAIALFGALSLSKRTAWFAQWAVTFVGIWLLFAPLLFWSPSAAQYLNNLIVGSLVIAFSVLVPMMPGMSMAGMMDNRSIPPGWTYSPSTDAQRFPIVVMGVIGFLIARMLTSYQLGHIDSAWEPFFAGSPADPRNGTEEIITSDVSKAWPIPDAGLGTVSYLLEILMAVMGTRTRWRTMPWMVTFFGILVIPLGVISIYFIIIQPIMIGTWSTPALVAGLAMLIMIPFALDEVIAMAQYLRWSKREGKPLIRTFFKGGAAPGGAVDNSDFFSSPRKLWNDTVRGVTLPGTLAASVVLGAFLMLTRLVLGTDGAMANSDHVVGALVLTVAIIATAEVARALRFINVGFGLWLCLAPFLLDGANGLGTVASIVIGVALVALSLPRGGQSEEHYAGWDRLVV